MEEKWEKVTHLPIPLSRKYDRIKSIVSPDIFLNGVPFYHKMIILLV